MESFPNARNVFEDAFNLPDPTPRLLELVRAHPELPTITDLLVIYMELVEKSPIQIDKLTGALANLKNSNDISIDGYDRIGNPIAYTINNELEKIFGSRLDDLRDGSVVLSNEYLTTSLLSAAAMKYRLCDSIAFPYAVLRALEYQVETRFDVATHEVLVLGACLQLSISGLYLCGLLRTGPDRVLFGLERIKRAGLLSHPNGQQLLEVCN